MTTAAVMVMALGIFVGNLAAEIMRNKGNFMDGILRGGLAAFLFVFFMAVIGFFIK